MASYWKKALTLGVVGALTVNSLMLVPFSSSAADSVKYEFEDGTLDNSSVADTTQYAEVCAVQLMRTSPETVSQSMALLPAGSAVREISPLTVPKSYSLAGSPGPVIPPLVVLTASVSALPPISSTLAETVSTVMLFSVDSLGRKTVSAFRGRSVLLKNLDLHGWMMSLPSLTLYRMR